MIFKKQLKTGVSAIALVASLMMGSVFAAEQCYDDVGNVVHHIPCHKEDSNKPYRLLSLDGGGLRGLIYHPQLWAIEKLTGKNIHELFDGIGGTSTGGITTLALTHRNANNVGAPMSGSDITRLYYHCSREIFRETAVQGSGGMISERISDGLKAISQGTGIKHYKEGLERIGVMIVGDSQFGPDEFVTDVFITTVNESRESELHIFSTLNPDSTLGAYNWQVARCTSAAKSYFPHIVLNEEVFVDGGHCANHPAHEFLREVQQNLKIEGENTNIFVLSFGTGDTSSRKTVEQAEAEGIKAKTLDSIQHLFSIQERTANKSLLWDITTGTRKDGTKNVVGHARSQVKISHEFEAMDNPKLARGLFEIGIQQIYGKDFQNILKTLIPGEVSREQLDAVVAEMRNEIEQIHFQDTREISLLGAICSFINMKEEGQINSQEDADAFFDRTMGHLQIDTMQIDELNQLLSWTSKMIRANAEHDADKTLLSKLRAYCLSTTSHGMIHNSILKIQNKAVERAAFFIMKKMNSDFDANLFLGESLDERISLFLSEAHSTGLSDNQLLNAGQSFKKNFRSVLLPDSLKDNAQYKRYLLILLNNIKDKTQKHYEASTGLSRALWNTIYTVFGASQEQSAHVLLINALDQLMHEISDDGRSVDTIVDETFDDLPNVSGFENLLFDVM